MKDGIAPGPARLRVQGGWSTRQLRAALLVVVVFMVAVFLVLRAPKEDATTPDDDRMAPRPEVLTPAPADADGPVESQPDDRPPWRPTFKLDRSTATDVQSALDAGDAALAEGNLFEPANDNALQHYLAALEMEPGNENAQEGLDAVVAKLVTEMEQALERHDLQRAETLAHVLEATFPDEPALSELMDQLSIMEDADRLIGVALEDIAAGRLVEPPERNAMERLSTVEKKDPEHPALRSSFRRLEEALVDRALSAARRDEFESAVSLLEKALAMREGSALLADASSRISSFQESRIAAEAAAARSAIHDARFGLARQKIVQVDALGAAPALVETLEQELAHARIYGNFSPGDRFSDPLGSDGNGPEMVVIPRGSFLMGAGVSDARNSEQPRHRVSFARGFALSAREISVEDFGRFVAATGYRADADREGFSFVYNESNGRIIRRTGVTWRHDYTGRDAQPEQPVLHISWNDADAYARWLSRTTGQPYRLPTEAEFEYAVRAGSYAAYWWGDGAPDRVVENLTGARDQSPRYRRRWNQAFDDYGDGHWGPAPVGSFIANPFGLYDMAGNVSEWVADCWHDSYVRAPSDGSAWVNPGCERRVVRAAFWGGSPTTARSAYRTGYPAEQRGSAIGFRVARDLFVPAD